MSYSEACVHYPFPAESDLRTADTLPSSDTGWACQLYHRACSHGRCVSLPSSSGLLASIQIFPLALYSTVKECIPYFSVGPLLLQLGDCSGCLFGRGYTEFTLTQHGAWIIEVNKEPHLTEYCVGKSTEMLSQQFRKKHRSFLFTNNFIQLIQ